jgi:hypothetical protein
MPGNLGMMLLAIFLIAFGVLTAPILQVGFTQSGNLLAVLAIVSGVLLLVQK